MKREALKPGDRVRVYRDGSCPSGQIMEANELYSFVRVCLDDGEEISPYRQQCRRLKAKPKPEDLRERPRIERWVGSSSYLGGATVDTYSKTPLPGCKRLLEVRPGEIIVNELMLSTAMDDLGDTVFRGVGNALMKKLMARLIALGAP